MSLVHKLILPLGNILTLQNVASIMFWTFHFSTLFFPLIAAAKRRMNEQYLAAAATESSPDGWFHYIQAA